MVDPWTVGRVDRGSNPPAVVSKLLQFRSPTLPVSIELLDFRVKSAFECKCR